MTSIRRIVGTALRRVDLTGFRRWGEALTLDIENSAYALARRIDPRDPLEGWSNLGYVSEDGIDLDAWSNEVMKPMQDAISDSIRRLAEAMEVPQLFVTDGTFADRLREEERPLVERAQYLTDQYAPAWEEILRLANPGSRTVEWRTPEPVDIEGVKDVVRKAYEDGVPLTPQVMRNFPEVTISREDLEFTPPSPAIGFEGYVRSMAEARAAAREQVMADWLDEVGTVVPGFDADAARQIVAERDQP